MTSHTLLMSREIRWGVFRVLEAKAPQEEIGKGRLTNSESFPKNPMQREVLLPKKEGRKTLTSHARD